MHADKVLWVQLTPNIRLCGDTCPPRFHHVYVICTSIPLLQGSLAALLDKLRLAYFPHSSFGLCSLALIKMYCLFTTVVFTLRYSTLYIVAVAFQKKKRDIYNTLHLIQFYYPQVILPDMRTLQQRLKEIDVISRRVM